MSRQDTMIREATLPCDSGRGCDELESLVRTSHLTGLGTTRSDARPVLERVIRRMLERRVADQASARGDIANYSRQTHTRRRSCRPPTTSGIA